MALTRGVADPETVSRTRGALTSAKFSVVTDGTNPDLNAPYAQGLDLFGIVPLSRSGIVDADLDLFDDSLNGRFLDWVEICVLRQCQTYWLSIPSRERWEDYEKDRQYQIQSLAEALKSRLDLFKSRYNNSGVAGVVRLERGIRNTLHTHRPRRRGLLDDL
jgi:hypothetical protein